MCGDRHNPLLKPNKFTGHSTISHRNPLLCQHITEEVQLSSHLLVLSYSPVPDTFHMIRIQNEPTFCILPVTHANPPLPSWLTRVTDFRNPARDLPGDWRVCPLIVWAF